MSKYDLRNICELARSDAGDIGYISTSDLAIVLLKKPDSILHQAIIRSKRNPDHFKELLLRFRPVSRNLSGKKPEFTKHLVLKLDVWTKEGIEKEEDITRALLEEANLLTYAANVLNIPSSLIIENIKESMIEGPVRINTYALNKGTNLTVKARRGELMPCIGRDSEIRKMASILLRMTKNFPVLVGDPGVGKTAVAEGLAQYLISDEAPAKLKGCTVIDFPVSLFTAGHKYVGETEKFTQRLLEELRRNNDIILFLDEIHQVIGAGKSENQNTDVAQILKPALARGEIKVIGATTLDEYIILEKDPAFERRMNPVRIHEPSKEDTIKILLGSKERYEKKHDIKVPDKLVSDIVSLSHDYLAHRKLPDKAFDLLDYSCSRVVTYTLKKILERQDIIETLVDMTGVEIANIDTSVEDKVSQLEKTLKKEVIGQDKAIHKVMNKLKLAYGGLMRRNKPLGVFLFLGVSGTGKTHLAKNIAKTLFGDDKRFLRIDMGEFTEANSVSRLIGSAPGYVGYNEGGLLTEFIKNNPFSVILFDEIEKAHYQIADVFLSLFGEGRITDGRGRTMDARNTICVMTSNHGVEQLRGHMFLGELDEEDQEKRLKDGLNKAFRPELLNRIDDVTVFKKLDIDDLRNICKLQLIKLKDRLEKLEVRFTFDEEIIGILSEVAQGMGTGARNLEGLIEDKVLLPLSEMRLNGDLREGRVVKSTVKGRKIVFNVEE